MITGVAVGVGATCLGMLLACSGTLTGGCDAISSVPMPAGLEMTAALTIS